MSTSNRERVLVAEDDPVASVIVQRVIERAGYEVLVVKDGRSALRELQKGNYFAVLADWMLPELDGIEVVRYATSGEGPKPKAFLTSVINIPAAREHAIAAGAQDFLAKPITPALLLKALRAEPEKRPVKLADGNHPLTRAEPWPLLSATSAATLSDMVGSELTVSTVPEVPELPLTLTCGLMDSANGTELVAWIAARESAALALTAAVLGEPPGELEGAAEMLAEMLNTVAGSVKSQFVNHGFKFTLGIPKRIGARELRDLTAAAFASVVSAITVGETSFILGHTATNAQSKQVRVEELREGFVLAEDLKNASGTLILLPACTRLTSTAVQRLRDSCKGRSVRVFVPAGVA